jgi:hypothetical protein
MMSVKSLTAIYQARGRYAQAEALLQRPIAIDEKVRGPNDSVVGAWLNGLASVY